MRRAVVLFSVSQYAHFGDSLNTTEFCFVKEITMFVSRLGHPTEGKWIFKTECEPEDGLA